MLGDTMLHKIQVRIRKVPRNKRESSLELLHHDLKLSCRLRGMPSAPSIPSSSACLDSRKEDIDVVKPVPDW